MTLDAVVEVHDAQIPASVFEDLRATLAWVPMYFLRRADRDPGAHPLDVYWYYAIARVDDRYADDAEPLLDELAIELAPVRNVWSIVRRLVGERVRLYECEYTANSFGIDGHPHHDSPRKDLRSSHLTAIVYCNEEWKLEWAGETVVVDRDGEIARAVLPRAGRICLIKGDPLHVARGVSRICPHARQVLVFKMWQIAQ